MGEQEPGLEYRGEDTKPRVIEGPGVAPTGLRRATSPGHPVRAPIARMSGTDGEWTADRAPDPVRSLVAESAGWPFHLTGWSESPT